MGVVVWQTNITRQGCQKTRPREFLGVFFYAQPPKKLVHNALPIRTIEQNAFILYNYIDLISGIKQSRIMLPFILFKF